MELLFDTLGAEARAPDVAAALGAMAVEGETGRGAVFTRPVVASSILDLVGYTVDRPLHELRLLEPSFGAGDFLLPAVDRLLDAYFGCGGDPDSAADDLAPAVRGVELHRASVEAVRSAVTLRLRARGVSESAAARLCEAWLICDDFLLCTLPQSFSVVVGNPPYVRQERIPAALLGEYRRRFRTMFDRADLYIPFFERSLDLLDDEGCLGFICANRWIKNRYGGPLREKVARDFHLRCYIDMEESDAFHSEVIAYPAITVIARTAAGSDVRATRVASAGLVREVGLGRAATVIRKGEMEGLQSILLDGTGDAPWLLDDVPRLALLRRLETEFPSLEAAGCKVGIGVATGCDRVFIGNFDELPVEASRKLPLVLARDLIGGAIRWSGKGVVNPFEPDGRLADFEEYPRFAAYLGLHRAAVAGRHVAARNPHGWYRTIDRINPILMGQPKLLVPDIKGEAVFVLDEGQYYPHHNLYYITSTDWPLPALQCVLSSSVALMFVATYCTRMAGGYLRFQAQYIRRIRLPRWRQVQPSLAKLLTSTSHDSIAAVDTLCGDLFGLDAEELATAQRVAAAARVTLQGRKVA